MRWLVFLILVLGLGGMVSSVRADELQWGRLPDLPDELGVAGPFVGRQGQTLLVAGGANFPLPVWETTKQWVSEIHTLDVTASPLQWRTVGQLPRPLAYGATVSLPDGILCLGGNDAERTYADAFLIQLPPGAQSAEILSFPSLPEPCAYGQAVLVGSRVFLAGGQSGLGLDTAMANLWMLDLSLRDQPERFIWQELEPCPGGPRAFSLLVAQHNGYEECLYQMSGRALRNRETVFLTDVWEYSLKTGRWRQRDDLPRCVMAGSAVAVGQSHLLVLGGDDGSRFFQADELKDEHPGFPRQALLFHTITNRWSVAGELPVNQVTTTAVKFGDRIVLASGEIRPRVLTPAVWEVRLQPLSPQFGALNYAVLTGYLLLMVGIGVYFARSNRNTDDYFRGGKQIPWWAAGCSIFATMLSSLTFTGIPSKAFAQDWVYALGNFMIPVVAVLGVYVALPFYRRIDATSAYEYLELRFDRNARWFGSASFSLFHLFRMAVVMSLTGLAIAVATPLTPVQAVLLMGVLSIIYCTLGGIEAVIWTDTLQTVVLLGGAIFALGLIFSGLPGGWQAWGEAGQASEKFRMVNWSGDWMSAELLWWVVIVGALGQNVSSYTADQAVVQRYMTTPTRTLAARSIWTNAVLTIPATLLFFSIGTALFMYYQAHPEKLSASVTNDQIFPLFIARELPVGVAGLMVAAIFAAAQSTVSTSMNSTSTCVVTDFLRPLNACRTEAGYFRAARWLTFLFGAAGTALAVLFVNPEILSLFDAFIKVIGLFMGVLGGLFVLGVVSRRANAPGALIGAFTGAAFMLYLWLATPVNGYLYTSCGIVCCFVVGYVASLGWSAPPAETERYTLRALWTQPGTTSAEE